MTSLLTPHIQSFGVAAAAIVGALFAIVIIGICETARQEIKIKSERRRRRVVKFTD